MDDSNKLTDNAVSVPLLELKDVSKFYNAGNTMAVGLHKVSARFFSGEFVGITGASGSGKSTILNVLSGIDSYEEGEMLLRGAETSHYTESERAEYRKRDVAFIFQDYFLVDSYTVYQNIELALLPIENDNTARHNRVMSLIEKVGLNGHAKQRVAKLSGGQKQRVAIARALAKNAPILFADEPTGNLDSKTSADILKLLHEVSGDKLVIVVTHSFDEIAEYATRKLRLSDGEIVEDIELNPYVKKEAPKGNERPFSFKEQYRGISRVAFYNLRATPKRTLFTFTGLVLLSLALILGIVFIDMILDTGDYYNGYSKYDIRVFAEDGRDMTEDDINTLKGINGVKSVRYFNELMSQSAMYSISDYSVTAYLRYSADFTGTLIDGRLPENTGEVVLNLPADKKVLKSVKIGDSVSIGVTGVGTMNFTVCGYTIGEDEIYLYEGWLDSLLQSQKTNVTLTLKQNTSVRGAIDAVIDSGYNCVYYYGIGEKFNPSAIFQWVIAISVVGIGSLVIMLVQGSVRTVGKQKKRDYNIMRTVGLADGFIKNVYYVEMAFNALIAWVSSLILAFAVALIYSIAVTPTFGYGMAIIGDHIKTISWVSFLTLALTVFVAETCAASFNKKFYKHSVKSSLLMED